MTYTFPRQEVGPLVREWRTRRRRSQMDLALDVGVSPRHLSFVETGRSRPSPELLLTLADHLDVPLRERNVFMLAAGYAPRFGRTSLDDPSMERVRAALVRLLDGHHPYPGVVIDRVWNVVLANPAAARLTEGLPPDVTTPVLNVFRVCLHPDGLAPRTRNFGEWAGYLLGQLGRLAASNKRPGGRRAGRGGRRQPHVTALDAGARERDEAALLVPWS